MSFKFRSHRGGLSEAMAEMQTFQNREELITHIKKELAEVNQNYIVSKHTVEIKPYTYDERIGWNTYMVTLKEYGVFGFTDGPVAPFYPLLTCDT